METERYELIIASFSERLVIFWEQILESAAVF